MHAARNIFLRHGVKFANDLRGTIHDFLFGGGEAIEGQRKREQWSERNLLY